MEEPYPPDTRVEQIDPIANIFLGGTVIVIPFPNPSGDSSSFLLYTILFDNGTLASIPLLDMASIIT